ncbi:MAG: methyltransferase domain-containing protein [Parachlamydia sp.]|nr:methyltransferase domain-containing protein [Parachlamydia sp.]
MQKKLNIIATDNAVAQPQPSERLSRRKEAEARFDRLWLVSPEQMNPLRNIRERERLDRTLDILKGIDLQSKRVVDLGCGGGVLSRKLRDSGAEVDAVDISSNALKL